MKIKIVVLTLTAVFWICTSFAKQTEADLIQMLSSGDYYRVDAALGRLPAEYPDSTQAVQIIRGILRSNEVITVTAKGMDNNREKTFTLRPMPHVYLARSAARALGNYHAVLDDDELAIIYAKLLHSRDEEAAMDGLKALRGMKVPQAVPEVIPLLEDQNIHVVRDAIRTLAVIGDKSVIPKLEPLLKHPHSDVRWDTQSAIKKLNEKQ